VDTDLILTLGIVLMILALPSLLSAWVEGVTPRVGAVMLIAGLGMIIAAVVYSPAGYPINEVPGVMVGVVARMIN
jgi:hypothetical protein